MELSSIDWQGRADQVLTDLLADLPPDEALYAAAVLLNRVATELHKRARAGANERRGSDAWGRWAGLQNLARNLVLQSSTCRDTAAAVTGRKR